LHNESAWSYEDCEGLFGQALQTFQGPRLTAAMAAPNMLASIASGQASLLPMPAGGFKGGNPWI